MAKRTIKETASADTLNPGNGSGGPGESLTSMMGDVLRMMRAAYIDDEDDLTKLRETLAQIGHEADFVPADGNQNLMTIQPKGIAADALKEDLDSLLNSEELELSEEFKKQAIKLFEAAVDLRVGIETLRLEEEMAEEIDNVATAIEEDMAEKVDDYITEVAKTFIKENEIAIEESAKSNNIESMITELRNVLSSYNIHVDDEDVDAYQQLQIEHQQMRSQLDETTNTLIQAQKFIGRFTKDMIVAEATEGLTDLDASRLRSLAEQISTDDPDEFAERLQIIRESYSTRSSSMRSSNMLLEEFEPTYNEEDIWDDEPAGKAKPRSASDIASVYAAAISRAKK